MLNLSATRRAANTWGKADRHDRRDVFKRHLILLIQPPAATTVRIDVPVDRERVVDARTIGDAGDPWRRPRSVTRIGDFERKAFIAQRTTILFDCHRAGVEREIFQDETIAKVPEPPIMKCGLRRIERVVFEQGKSSRNARFELANERRELRVARQATNAVRTRSWRSAGLANGVDTTIARAGCSPCCFDTAANEKLICYPSRSRIQNAVLPGSLDDSDLVVG